MMPIMAQIVVLCGIFNVLGILVGVRWGYRRGMEDAESYYGNKYAQRERERLIYSRN